MSVRLYTEPTAAFGEETKVEPMVTLLKELAPGVDPTGLGFGQLRDELLKLVGRFRLNR